VSLGFVDELEVKIDLKTPVNSESKQKPFNTDSEKSSNYKTPSPVIVEGESSDNTPNM